MDNYFQKIADSIQEPQHETHEKSREIATLTVKVDIDAKIYCDGDFLDLVEANVVKKIPIELGQHLITVEPETVEGVSEDREVDIKEAGKNYLLIVKGIQTEAATQKEQTISDNTEELIDRICSEDGLLALFRGAYVLGEDQDEPLFTFEPFEYDHQTPWDEEVVNNLLNGKSIVVFKVNCASVLDEYGVKTMAKHISINDYKEPIECYVYILSLKQIREGLKRCPKHFDQAVSMMESFVEKIDYYNSDQWQNFDCLNGIPKPVAFLLTIALAMCNKQEAESYIKHH